MPGAEIEAHVSRYADPSSLTDAEDLLLSREIARFCTDGPVPADLSLRLVEAVVRHAADGRASFRERAAFVATALFGKDEFGVRGLGSYASFEDVLPREITSGAPRDAPPQRRSPIAMPPPEPPMFLQEVVKILEGRENDGRLACALGELPRILRRTSDFTLGNYKNALFNSILNLGIPGLADEQARLLGILCALDPELLGRVVCEFFASTSEIRQLVLMSALERAEEGAAPRERVSMHLLFAERFMEHDGAFGDLVRARVARFLEGGLRLVEGACG